MFDEFDELEEKNEKEETNTYNYEPLFVIENIKNKDIGKRIKKFSKIFLKVEMAFIIFVGLVSFIGICASAEVLGAGIMLALLFMFFGLFFAFFVAYYLFLIVSGFGAIIEDINAIRLNTNKQTKTTKKTADSVK